MRLVKIVMCLLFFFVCIADLAAQQKIWRVGLHLGNGYYQLYNKNDWNADPILIYPVKGSPTNWTVGATTTYTWGKHWRVNSGLIISKNKQAFQAAKDPNSPNQSDFYGITNDFNFLKIPINFQFSSNNEATHQVRISIGIQPSFLISYKEHFLQTSTNFRSEFVIKNKTGTSISVPGNLLSYDNFFYNRFLIGSVGELMYCYKTDDGWLFAIGLRGEYDFSNAENRKTKVVETGELVWQSGIKRYGYGDINTRPKTHNRAIGLFISASIPVDIR